MRDANRHQEYWSHCWTMRELYHTLTVDGTSTLDNLLDVEGHQLVTGIGKKFCELFFKGTDIAQTPAIPYSEPFIESLHPDAPTCQSLLLCRAKRGNNGCVPESHLTSVMIHSSRRDLRFDYRVLRKS